MPTQVVAGAHPSHAAIAARPRTNTALWVVIALLSSITIAAIGIAAVRFSSSSTVDKREAKRAKASASEEDENGGPDPTKQGEIMKGVVKSIAASALPRIQPRAGRFGNKGSLSTAARRFVARLPMRLQRSRKFVTSAVRYGARSGALRTRGFVLTKDQPSTRSLMDSNGNTFVLQAATDAEAAAAGELAAGRATAK